MARRCRHPMFKGRHFDQEIIVLCVRWYVTYKLSYRDLAAMMLERGIAVALSTIFRWVQRYVPEFEKRWDRFPRPVFVASGTRRSWSKQRGTRIDLRESWMHSRIITTRTACTAPSTAPRRFVAPAHHSHRPRVLLFANMLGRSIVAVCFTHRFHPEHEFATNRFGFIFQQPAKPSHGLVRGGDGLDNPCPPIHTGWLARGGRTCNRATCV